MVTLHPIYAERVGTQTAVALRPLRDSLKLGVGMYVRAQTP
jgi:hypothetical protein